MDRDRDAANIRRDRRRRRLQEAQEINRRLLFAALFSRGTLPPGSLALT
jgi:hypothetical protein